MAFLGPVMIDVDGFELSDDDRILLKNPLVGGVILFTRNFDTPQQVQQLIEEVKSLRDPPLLIAIDHEGGRVQRFKEPFTIIPALNTLGVKYDKDRDIALEHAELFGWLTSIELLSFNIDFSFTPVLDVDYGLSDVIGNRAFHQNPNVIAKLAAAYIDGMHRAGMSSTGKHFPGHGGVTEDSHTDVPIDNRTLDVLFKSDIIPFEKLVPNHLDGIMPAHIIYEKINDAPAGFSSFWLKEILRTQLKFDGVVFSDDLDMKGASCISDSYAERAKAALEAGCDMVLVCNNRSGAAEVLDELTYTVTNESHLHLLKMRRKNVTPHNWDDLVQTNEWKQAVTIISEYQ